MWLRVTRDTAFFHSLVARRAVLDSFYESSRTVTANAYTSLVHSQGSTCALRSC
jgi:hypothetical protein